MTTELELRALLIAVSKTSWSRSKCKLMTYLAGNDSGAALGTILSQVATAEETGMSATTVRKCFLELVDERVLLRYDGRGSRGHAFRINWRFDEWRVRWLGADPLNARAAAAARDAALAHLASVLHPPADRNPRFVARPGARQQPIAARSGASLFGASRAPDRATTEDLSARPGARQANGRFGPHTIPSNSEPHSLTQESDEGGSEQADLLLATITDRAGAPIFGSPAKEVRALVDGSDPADLIGAVHRAPPGLKVVAYVEIVRQAIARRGFTPAAAPAPSVPAFVRPAYEDEDPAPPPWRAAGYADRRAWVEAGSPGPGEPGHDKAAGWSFGHSGTAACETDAAGGGA